MKSIFNGWGERNTPDVKSTDEIINELVQAESEAGRGDVPFIGVYTTPFGDHQIVTITEHEFDELMNARVRAGKMEDKFLYQQPQTDTDEQPWT